MDIKSVRCNEGIKYINEVLCESITINYFKMKNYFQETFSCSDEEQKKKVKTDTESTEIQQDADEVVKPGGDIPEEKI